MLYIIIILIILILYIIFNYLIKYNIESFTNINSKIPYILFKTGPYDISTNELEKLFKMNKINLNVKKVLYYNNQECYDFMKKLQNNIFQAYQNLIPAAYKADLWRYCILYKYGGIYGDLTQTFLKNYNVNEYNVDMVLVKDIKPDAIQISFMATKPNNKFYKYLIECISNDILHKRKGKNCLDITGPNAFYRYFCKYFNIYQIPNGTFVLKGLNNDYYKIRIDLKQHELQNVFINIFNHTIIASTKTKDHNKNLVLINKRPHYEKLYKQNIIFKN